MRRIRNERRIHNEHGVILDWLLRVVIWVGIAGVILFDAGAIFVNLITLDGTAKETVEVLDDDVKDGHLATDVQVKEAVKKVVKPHGARVVSASVDQDGLFKITLRREAGTLIVKRISAIRDWGITTADAQTATR